jgi:hypothetical protein
MKVFIHYGLGNKIENFPERFDMAGLYQDLNRCISLIHTHFFQRAAKYLKYCSTMLWDEIFLFAWRKLLVIFSKQAVAIPDITIRLMRILHNYRVCFKRHALIREITISGELSGMKVSTSAASQIFQKGGPSASRR